MVTTQDTKTSAFPVDWNGSIEPGVTFMFDPMHFPYPVSPLLQSTMGPACGAGFTAAANEYNLPIQRVEVCHIAITTVTSGRWRSSRQARRKPGSWAKPRKRPCNVKSVA